MTAKPKLARARMWAVKDQHNEIVLDTLHRLKGVSMQRLTSGGAPWSAFHRLGYRVVPVEVREVRK